MKIEHACSSALLILLSCVSALRAADENASGPVAWWPGDGDEKDRRSGHDGIFEPHAEFSDGPDGRRVFHFTGENSVRIEDLGEAGHLDGFNSFTIAAWIKPLWSSNRVESHAILSKYDSVRATGGKSYFFSIRAGLLHLAVIEADNILRSFETTSPLVVSGRVQHVAAVWGGGDDATLYLNGQPQPASTLSHQGRDPVIALDNDVPLRIGAIEGATRDGNPEQPAFLFVGDIWDVRLYNRELSPAEIGNLYEH